MPTGSTITIICREDRKVDKNSALVKHVKEWVDAQYDDGRVTVITDQELVVTINGRVAKSWVIVL